ncbi:MAG TPA: hypothetical protein VGH86_14790 [Phenylobacterium sp.]|jgi:hypothetical protein
MAGAMSGREEASVLYASACEAWLTYWTAVAQARDLEGCFQAQQRLVTDIFGLAGHAAAVRQRFAGRITPTLNEA